MPQFEDLVVRLEKAVSRLEQVGTGGSSTAATDATTAVHRTVQALDAIGLAEFADFIAASDKIGSDIKFFGTHFKKLFAGHREFINFATKCKEPDMTLKTAVFKDLIESKFAPISKKIRKSKNFQQFKQHFNAVENAMTVFNWVGYSQLPLPMIQDANESTQFYTNKIKKEKKNTEGGEDHLAWIISLHKFLKAMYAYVKDNYAAKLIYNGRGADPSAYKFGGATTAAPKKEESKTAQTAVAKPKPKVKAKAKKGFGFLAKKKRVVAPLLELDEGAAKWVCENYKNDREIVIKNEDIKNSVCVYNCQGSFIQIPNKVKTVLIDSCKKSDFFIPESIGNIEIVNCKVCKLQVATFVPAITVDNCSRIHIYLSQECVDKDTKIVVSAATDMNITVPDPKDPNDTMQLSVPQQFEITFDKKQRQLRTDIVEHM